MNASLRVDRNDLVQSIKMLAKFVKAKKHGKRMIISFIDDTVTLEASGILAKAGAEGMWPGQVRVDSGFVLGLAGALPEDEIVTIRVEQGRLHIANFSTPCTWQGIATASIRLPVNPSFTEILALRSKYSDEEIEQSGLSDTLRAAEKRRDSLVGQAAWILEPLGIGRDDLYRLIEQRTG